MNLSAAAAQKLTPWYVASCTLPYLPALIANLGFYPTWSTSIAFLGLSVVCIIVVCLVNLVAGPFLAFRLRGARRFVVILALLAGAIFPIAVAVIALISDGF
ncbi:MAG: hypothetical protein ACJA2X_000954 [Halocynthiibacter sp.]|jgi:hypothetical protein